MIPPLARASGDSRASDLHTARVVHDEHSGLIVTLTMPLPPASVGKNGRPGHWSERARAYARLRDAGAWALMEPLMGMDRPLWDGPVVVTITWYAARRWWTPDVDNITGRCAVYLDAGQLACLYADDVQIERIDVVRRVDAADPRVVLEWRAVETEEAV